MKKLTICLALGLLLGSVVPVWSGTVYVPLAVNRTVEGNQLETEIRVTNDSSTSTTLYYVLIPSWTDGTTIDRDTATKQMTVPSHSTIRLDELITPGKYGALEITAGKEIAVSARLVGVSPDGRQAGAEMPIVTSATATSPGDTTILQGLSRVEQVVATDFHLFNLSRNVSDCVVEVFRGNGSRVTAVTLAVSGLTLVPYEDVLALLNMTDVEDIRIAVTCDQISYPFAMIHHLDTAEVLFLGPSGTGASSLDPFPACPPGALYAYEGVFHVPAARSETKQFNIKMQGGQQYSKIILDMDFTHGGWNSDSSGNHSVFWLNRGDRWRGNVFGYVTAWGPNKNYIKMATNVDLPAGQMDAVQKGLVLKRSATYHVHYEYDTANRRIECTFTDETGNRILLLENTPTVNKIVTESPGFFVVFGHGSHEAGPEVPTYGWEYANLCIQIQ